MGYQSFSSNTHNYSVINSSVNGKKKTIIIKDNTIIINGKKYVIPDSWASYKTNVVNGRLYVDGHDVEKELINDGEIEMPYFNASVAAFEYPHYNYNDVPEHTDRKFRTISGLEQQIKKERKEAAIKAEEEYAAAKAEQERRQAEKEAACKQIEYHLREKLSQNYGTITDLDAFMEEIYGISLSSFISKVYDIAYPNDMAAISDTIDRLERKRHEEDNLPYREINIGSNNKIKNSTISSGCIDDLQDSTTYRDDGVKPEKIKKKKGLFTAISRLFR